MYVCVCVCVYVYACMYMSGSMYACACMRACVRVCLHSTHPLMWATQIHRHVKVQKKVGYITCASVEACAFYS